MDSPEILLEQDTIMKNVIQVKILMLPHVLNVKNVGKLNLCQKNIQNQDLRKILEPPEHLEIDELVALIATVSQIEPGYPVNYSGSSTLVNSNRLYAR